MKWRYFTCKQKKIKFKCYSFCVTLHNGSCAKWTTQRGKCGSAHWWTVSFEPTENLCELWTASSVTTHGGDWVYWRACWEGVTYAWSCVLDKQPDFCYACQYSGPDRPINSRLCGPLEKVEMEYFPDKPSASDLCQKGTPWKDPLVVDLKNGQYMYEWTCTYGTETQTCIATAYCGKIIREGREEYINCR